MWALHVVWSGRSIIRKSLAATEPEAKRFARHIREKSRKKVDDGVRILWS